MLDYSSALQELKKRYTKGQVSALIGSGFSKNVSSLFPLWNELLKDIVDELYCEDYRCKSRFQRKRQKRIREKQLRQIIQNDGYLNIIERYIAKKGFREAIEVYIEDHIPKVNLKNNSLIFKGGTVQLTDEDWQVHSQLLSGNWKNIYTTNYDSLLESAVTRDGKSWRTVKSAQDLAAKEISALAVERTILTAKAVLAQKLDAHAQDELIEASIKNLSESKF